MKLRHLLQIFIILAVSACGPATLNGSTPTPVLLLPDLIITTAYVSMVDFNGNCLTSYELGLTVANQSNVPANDVSVVETITGHQIQAGTLGAFQSMTIYMPASSPTGAYIIVADPQNNVIESNEDNNITTFSAATATPPAMCPPPQTVDATPTPLPLPISVLQNLDGLVYANMDLGQIWRITTGGFSFAALQTTNARFSPDGLQAIIESQGDLLLAEPMDNPGINITNTPDHLEILPQWWRADPAKIVFNSMGSKEAQQKGWDNSVIGYLSMMNKDGSERVALDDLPSYTAPGLSPDGKIIAYDRSGTPMLYEIGKGSRPFDPTTYGYYPSAEAMFTSPSFSPYQRYLTWWVSENTSQTNRQFSLLVFDLYNNTFSSLRAYVPLPDTLGWLPNPTWNGNEGWIAYQTRGEVTVWDLWISRPDESEAYRLGLATNPVWSPDLQHLAYVQWPPHTDSYLAGSLNIIETSTWNTQQGILSAGSIPLVWIHPAYMNVNYFPMFAAPGDWLAYSNSNPVYQIQYPPNAFIETTPGTLTIHIPIQPGTQMTEKYLNIETRADTIDNCYAFSPWDGKTLLNGLDFKFYGGKYWETSADGGRFLMGNYAIYQNGSCYRIQLRMTALSDATPAPAPSRADMDVEILLNILSTLR